MGSKRRPARFEVRPVDGRFAVWDTENDQVATECVWYFRLELDAEKVADSLNRKG